MAFAKEEPLPPYGLDGAFVGERLSKDMGWDTCEIVHRPIGAEGELSVRVIRRTTAKHGRDGSRLPISAELARRSVALALVLDNPEAGGGGVLATTEAVGNETSAWREREVVLDGKAVVGFERGFGGRWLAYCLTPGLIVYVVAPAALRLDTVELRTLRPEEIKEYKYLEDKAVDDGETDEDSRGVKGWRQPKGMLPRVVPVELVLTAGELAAVYLSHIEAYSVGFMIHLMVVRRGEPAGQWSDDPQTSSDKDRDGLRFSVRFSDGLVLGGAGNAYSMGRDMGMRLTGGGGSYERWNKRYWVWPIPPPGQIMFCCEWKQLGMRETKSALDAAKVRDAATRAIAVFGELS